MQNLGLLVAHRVRLEGNRRLHRGQADELHDVVGHHIAQRAGRIVVAAALFHAHGFAHGNLHMIDVAPVPDRFENPIGKAKGQNVLHRFFAQVVVDAVNLLFVHFLEQLLVQRPGRIQVAAERLFDDHPAPLMVFFLHQAGGGQLLHDGAKEIRRGGEIVEIIPVSGVVFIDFQ